MSVSKDFRPLFFLSHPPFFACHVQLDLLSSVDLHWSSKFFAIKWQFKAINVLIGLFLGVLLPSVSEVQDGECGMRRGMSVICPSSWCACWQHAVQLPCPKEEGILSEAVQWYSKIIQWALGSVSTCCVLYYWISGWCDSISSTSHHRLPLGNSTKLLGASIYFQRDVGC